MRVLLPVFIVFFSLSGCKTSSQAPNSDTSEPHNAVQIEKGEKGERGDVGPKGDKGDKGEPGKDANVLPEKIVVILKYNLGPDPDLTTCKDGTQIQCSILRTITKDDFFKLASIYASCKLTSFAPGYYYIECGNACVFDRNCYDGNAPGCYGVWYCPGPMSPLKSYKCASVPYANTTTKCEWSLPFGT